MIIIRGASFRNIEELRKAIEEFVAAYKTTAKPFIWRKREVKGAQLRNTICVWIFAACLFKLPC